MLPCDAILCAIPAARSLPRRRMRRVVLAVRNHTRRRNALLIAALSARAREYSLNTHGTHAGTRVHKVLSPAHAYGTHARACRYVRVLTLSPARHVGDRPVRCDGRLCGCPRPRASYTAHSHSSPRLRGPICAVRNAHPACVVQRTPRRPSCNALPGVQHALPHRACAVESAQPIPRRHGHASAAVAEPQRRRDRSVLRCGRVTGVLYCAHDY